MSAFDPKPFGVARRPEGLVTRQSVLPGVFGGASMATAAAALAAWLKRQGQTSSAGVPLRFAFRHPWDRIAFPVFVALIWIVILMGFVPEVIDQLQNPTADFVGLVEGAIEL